MKDKQTTPPTDTETVVSAQLHRKHRVGGLSTDPEKAEKQLAPLREHHWPKGKSGNPNGRPRDPVKEIGKRIARAKVSKVLKPKERQLAEDMGFQPDDITLLEHLMLRLATSANPQKIALYLERTYGKVPNININAEVNAALVTKFRNKFTDAELESIADGANPMDILFDKIPDVEDDMTLDADETDSFDATNYIDAKEG